MESAICTSCRRETSWIYPDRGRGPFYCPVCYVPLLKEALEESVKLQSHYAMLLNGWDGGERMRFGSADEWLKRLASLKSRASDVTEGV